MRLEGEAVAPLRAVYKQMRREVLDKLNRMAPGASQFSRLHLELLLSQVDASLSVMAVAQGMSLRDHCERAMAAASVAEVRNIATLEAKYGEALLAARVAEVQPIIQAQTVARMADSQRLILQGLKQRVRQGIAGELAQSLAQGEGIAKATRRLRGHLDKQDWQLERIARTEINNAVNAGHHQAIDEVTERFPELGLKKQWSSHLDGRTSRLCIHLHGDVVAHDANFEGLGWSGPYPPGHPGCRSRVVSYSERWKGRLQPRSPEQKAADAERFATERPRRRSAVKPRKRAA